MDRIPTVNILPSTKLFSTNPKVGFFYVEWPEVEFLAATTTTHIKFLKYLENKFGFQDVLGL